MFEGEEIPNQQTQGQQSQQNQQIVIHQKPRPDFNSSQKITNVPLNGRNYLPWSKAARVSLKGKGLIGIITGSKPRPASVGDAQEEWDILDGQTVTLILNSLEPQLSEIFIYHDTAKELWEAIEEQYGRQNNHAAMFQLQREIFQITQGTRSVSDLIGQMKAKFKEIDTYRPATTDLTVLQERKEQDQIYYLLAALDPSYDAIRAQILNSTERLTFTSVVVRIQQKESRRVAMNSSDQNPKSEGHAFSTINPSAGGNNAGGGAKGRKGPGTKCAHCNHEGHVKEGCWILHPHLKRKWRLDGGGHGGDAKRRGFFAGGQDQREGE